MATQKSIVELILQAKVEGEKSLEQLTNFTSELIEQQKEGESVAATYEQKMEKLRGTLDGLVRAERDLIGKGRLVEKFKEQAAATSKADAKAKQLAKTAHDLRVQFQDLEKGSSQRLGLEKQFDRASVAAQKASANFSKQKTRLAELTSKLKTAGLSVGNLAKAESRLAQEATRVQAAQNSTADSIARVQVQADKAAKGIGRFGKNSRTSLSLIQRLRGEVLALGAAYVGLFGIGREVGSVFDAVRQKQAIESRFRVAFDGDPDAAAKVERELGFVRKTADKLKISFLTLGTEYSKFISSVPEGIFTLQQQRKIFSDIATGARVMRLSQEEVAGTFKAILQIASKGTFQMEELRGQLGDRLPGALLLFAKQMKVSTRELDKMVEQGEVGADKLTVLAEAIEQRFGGDLAKALQASTTQLDAFFLEVERLRIELGEDSGFVDTLGDSLGALSEEIRKPEFKEGLTKLAQLMGQLVKAGVLLIKNIDVIKSTLVAFLGVRILGGLIVGFFKAKKAALGLSVALRNLSFIGFAASGPAGWIVALVVGIAAIALKSRESGPAIDDLTKRYSDLGDAAEEASEKINKGFGGIAIDDQVASVDSKIKIILKDFGRLVAEADRLKVRDARHPYLSKLLGTKEQINDVGSAIRGASKQLAELNRQRDLLLEGETRVVVAPANLGLNEKQLEELEKAIAQANKEINKFEAVTLQQKLAQVDKAFASLLETAKSADDPAVRAAQEAKVFEAIAAKKRAITLGEERKLLKEFERLENAAAKKSSDTLQGRLDNIRLKYDSAIKGLREVSRNVEADRLESTLATELAGEIDQVKAKLRETLTQIRAEDGNDLDARLQLVREKYIQLIADLNAAAAEGVDIGDGLSLAGDTLKQEEDAIRLAHAEEEINRLMEVREARLARISLQQEAGILTAFDAQEQMQATVEELDPQLQSMLDKAIAMAAAMGNPQMVENLKSMKAEIQLSAKNLDPFLQKLGEIRESFANGLTGAATDWVKGIKSAKDAFRQFAVDFLTQIAQMILKQQILIALQSVTGTLGGGDGSSSSGGGFLSSLFHQGGIAGQGGGSSRYVSPLAFAGAYRYHSGGVAGLRPDETAAILQKGEEVLTKTDPRHRNNGGASAGPRIKIVNTIDSEEMVSEGLSTGGGEQAVMNVIQANKSSIKQILDA